MIRSCLDGRSLGISGVVRSAAIINEPHEGTRVPGLCQVLFGTPRPLESQGAWMAGKRSGEAFNQRSMKVVDHGG